MNQDPTQPDLPDVPQQPDKAGAGAAQEEGEDSQSMRRTVKGELETLVSSLHGVPQSPQQRGPHEDLGEVAVPQTLGQYRLLEKLGEGGMGAVYRARHERLQRVVALKLLPRQLIHSTEAVARFQREMTAVGKLSHPNIVVAHDAGEADGHQYLAMELVNGVDLSSALRQLGPLSEGDACELIRQAALGLHHAHQRGLVHRDVKPSNLMLLHDSERGPLVKVLDLGLARLDEAHAETGELTAAGQMMGTIDYMAPEQTDGRSVDGRSDVYSLGATLYKLLCGAAPYADCGRTLLEKLGAMARGQAPSIRARRPDISPALADLVDGLISPDPNERLPSAAAVAEALAPHAASAELQRLIDQLQESLSLSAPVDGEARTEPMSPSPGLAAASEERSPAASLAAPRVGSSRSFSAPRQGSHQGSVWRSPRRLAIVVTASILLLVAAVIAAQVYFGRDVLKGGEGELEIAQTDGQVDGQVDQDVQVDRQIGDAQSAAASSQGDFAVRQGDVEQAPPEPAPAATQRVRGQPEPSPPFGSPRSREYAAEVAQWALSIGGRVHLPGRGWIERPQDLPAHAVFDAIDLSGCEQAAGPQLGRLQQVEGLKSLNLKGTPVEAVQLRDTASRSLELLDVSDTRMDDAALSYAGQLPQLKSIVLSGTEVSRQALDEFRRQKPDCRVRSDFPNQDVAHWILCEQGSVGFESEGRQGQASRVEQLPQDFYVTEVRSLGQVKVTDEDLDELARLTRLASLQIPGSEVSDSGLQKLAAFPALIELDLSRAPRITDAGMPHLARLPRLTTLKLQRTAVTNEARQQLRRQLPRCAVDGVALQP